MIGHRAQQRSLETAASSRTDDDHVRGHLGGEVAHRLARVTDEQLGASTGDPEQMRELGDGGFTFGAARRVEAVELLGRLRTPRKTRTVHERRVVFGDHRDDDDLGVGPEQPEPGACRPVREVRPIRTQHDDVAHVVRNYRHMTATWEERRLAGRELRKAVPRSAHAEWNPPSDRPNPVDVLEAQGRTRVQALLPIRYGRMAQSPFAFYRGGAAIMAMDLSSLPATGLRVQACGDAHVSNFGKFATPERNMVFDINDFDETLPGPWEWDVKRLAASLQVVGHQRGFLRSSCESIVTTAVRSYREHMADAAKMRTLELWSARLAIKDVLSHFPAKYRPTVQRDVDKAQGKDQQRAVAKLTDRVDGNVKFVENPPLVVHIDNTEHGMGDVAPTLAAYRENLAHDLQHLFDRFRLTDVARKVVGVGSVGTRCWICLFEGPDLPRGDRMILQVKEAVASVLEPYVGASTLGHHGLRVVAGQRITQAASDIFLGWTEGTNTGHEYYVRQLWDRKGSSNPMRMDVSNLSYYGALCAMALARAHARTGDPVQIAGYLGKSDTFDRAIAAWSAKYASTNNDDYAALLDAIQSGRLEASTEF